MNHVKSALPNSSIFVEALKRLWGAPAIIAIVVLFVLIYLHSIDNVSSTLSFLLVGVVLAGMVLGYLLELRKLDKEHISINTVERLIALEIKDSIMAYLEGEEKGDLIYVELIFRFKGGAGLKQEEFYKLLFAGIGGQMEDLMETKKQKQAEKYLGALNTHY